MNKPIVCHFSSVHSIDDTRVFHRECVSLAQDFQVTYIGIGDFKGDRNGVQVIGLKASKSKLFRAFFTGFKAFTEAIKTDACIYHIHDPEMIPFGIFLSISGKQVIYDIHENTYGDIQYREWIPIKWRKLIGKFYQLMLKAANNYLHIIPVIANKSFQNRLFLKEGNFTCIQNFAPINQLSKYRVENRYELVENKVLYAGLIQDHYYDIHPLLEAIELLNQKGFYVNLHVAGFLGWGNMDEILSHHPQLKKEQVIFHGKLKPDEVYQLSKSCKIGVCLKNQPEHLVFSHERKLFEYIALGLPSIFCNNQIYLELNSPHEIGIPVNLQSATEISEAFFMLLSDTNLQQKMAKNCIQLAENSANWESEYLKLQNCYTQQISAN
ncbi:MAG: glycosyltransferase [Bacteroidia bacterium]